MKRSAVSATATACAVLVALTALCVCCCTALPLSRKHVHATAAASTHHLQHARTRQHHTAQHHVAQHQHQQQQRGAVSHQRSSSFGAASAAVATRTRGFKCPGAADYPELPPEQLPLRQSAEFKTYASQVLVIDGEAAYAADADFQKHVKEETPLDSVKGKYLKTWVAPMLDWAAKFVQPKFAGLLYDFGVSEFGLERYVEVLVAPPKSLKSAIPKIGNDYGGDLTRLVDGVRGSLVYQTEPELRAGACAFKAFLETPFWKSKYGCSVVTSKNRWDKPLDSGYRDFMMTIKCVVPGANSNSESKSESPYNNDIAFYAEVQIHMCAHLMVKQATVKEINEAFEVKEKKFLWNGHEGYEEVRKSKFPVDWKKDPTYQALSKGTFREAVNALVVPSAAQTYKLKEETIEAIRVWFVKHNKYLENEKVLNEWAAAKPGSCDMSRVAAWVAAQHKVAPKDIQTFQMPWHSKDVHSAPLVGGTKLETDKAKAVHDKSVTNAKSIKSSGKLKEPPKNE